MRPTCWLGLGSGEARLRQHDVRDALARALTAGPTPCGPSCSCSRSRASSAQPPQASSTSRNTSRRRRTPREFIRTGESTACRRSLVRSLSTTRWPCAVNLLQGRRRGERRRVPRGVRDGRPAGQCAPLELGQHGRTALVNDRFAGELPRAGRYCLRRI